MQNKIKRFFVVNWLLLLIIFLGAILRVWNFTSNPPNLYVDEVSHGYNAYSILKTARDEYGNFMPYFFRSFDTYNPPLAVYTLVPSILLFGLNEFAVRLPSVVAGILFLPLTYILVQTLFNNKKLARSAVFFLSISPWHIHFTRFYHEQHLSVFFSTLAITLFLLASKRPIFYIFSAMSFALSINYSHGAIAFVPLLILITILFFQTFKKKPLVYLVVSSLILLFGTLPFLINSENAFARAQSVSIFSDNTSEILNKIAFGYLSHFSPNFLFAKGDFQGRHAVPGMGELYVFEIPFIILGLFCLLKKKDKSYKFLLVWLLIAPIPAALSQPNPHAARSLTFIPAWSIVTSIGFMYFLKNFSKLLIFPLVLLSFYNILTYLHLYYLHYPKEKALDSAGGYKEMAQYVAGQYENYERIAITKYWGLPYIYILFYSNYDPSLYQKESEEKNAFGKYEFYLGAPKQSDKKTLFISTAEHTQNILRKFTLKNGDVIFVAHDK